MSQLVDMYIILNIIIVIGVILAWLFYLALQSKKD